MTSLSIRRPATIGVLDWFTYSDNTIDGQSRKKAYTLFESDLLNSLAPGSMKCLQQIHAYLFGGLYDFAGQIRDKNISKGGFTFANCMHFPTVIPTIERIPETTLDEIADKYVEMNVVHPFMEGNGRSMRIWLDLMLRHSLKRCVDWSRIDKNEYLTAMRESVVDSSHIKALLKVALTDKINDREMFRMFNGQRNVRASMFPIAARRIGSCGAITAFLKRVERNTHCTGVHPWRNDWSRF